MTVRLLYAGAVICCLLPANASAQDLSALAKLDPSASQIDGSSASVTVSLRLSQSVPWRARLLDNPPRLILDFREVDFSQLPAVPASAEGVRAVRAGVFRSGWSRLVLELSGPYLIDSAGMQTSDTAADVSVVLSAADAEAFQRDAALPEPPEWTLPALLPDRTVSDPESDRVVVVLDPGHGGIDPGAEQGGYHEASLMLTFARELKDLFLREGRFDVVMTREEDVFVPLESRISIARAVDADVFISLHADALPEGEAVGAVIYTLSEEDGDEAAMALAERHERDDILAGVDLGGQDDLVATVLMDMARAETSPRTERLALALEEAIKTADLKLHRFPRQDGGFSVLKSPDIPSVLIELGFMSSARDLARLDDAEWRGRMAEAIRDGVMLWAQEDAALRAMQRN